MPAVRSEGVDGLRCLHTDLPSVLSCAAKDDSPRCLPATRLGNTRSSSGTAALPLLLAHRLIQRWRTSCNSPNLYADLGALLPSWGRTLCTLGWLHIWWFFFKHLFLAACCSALFLEHPGSHSRTFILVRLRHCNPGIHLHSHTHSLISTAWVKWRDWHTR